MKDYPNIPRKKAKFEVCINNLRYIICLNVNKFMKIKQKTQKEWYYGHDKKTKHLWAKKLKMV